MFSVKGLVSPRSRFVVSLQGWCYVTRSVFSADAVSVFDCRFGGMGRSPGFPGVAGLQSPFWDIGM